MADIAQIKLPNGSTYDLKPYKLANKDTRSDDEIPSFYMSHYPRSMVNEFKYCNAIGVSSLLTGTYCDLLTIIPWSDSSGGRPIQIAISDSGNRVQRVATADDTWGSWVTLPNSDTNTTYTFANGTNGFTVTPSGGSAQTVTVTPSITNNVTGSGTSGYIAKFNGANTITNGPAIGSGTTKFLREDGTWQTPPSGSDTTYTLGTSGNNVTLTPSSGSVQSITVPYATSADSATSATTASKLGSSNVGDNIRPIYLSSGVPTQCSYFLKKNVPSDAVFTDTTYSAGTGLSLSGTTFSSKIWEGTQAQYDALTTKDSDTTYYITDGGVSGPLSLDDLENVDIATTPTDGEILVYNSTTSTWKNSGSNTDLVVHSLRSNLNISAFNGWIGGNQIRATSEVTGGYTYNISLNGDTGKAYFRNPATSTGIYFPNTYSDTEHVVSYWVDGSPVYEKTVILSSSVSMAAGNTSAAGAWTVVQTGWTTPIKVIDFLGYSLSDTGDPTYFGHLTAQWERGNNRIRVLNIRSQASNLTAFTIRYIYE